MFGLYDIDNATTLNYKERFDIYKSIGFKEVAIYLDNAYLKEPESYEQLINYANKINLQIKQIHIDYKISNLITDETTNTYFEYLEQKINECIKFNIPYLVTHASMGDTPPEIGEKQLLKLKNLCEKYKNKNVIICFENVRNNTNLDKIINLNLPNIKVCFDLGHAHCYGDEKRLFNKYLPYICCTHLHNNFGKDTHNLLNFGDINYKYFLNNLKNNNSLSNCLECFPEYGKVLNKEEFTLFIKNCFDCLK